jgi:protein-L-isoaspartate(D-aspartate) O-methyltransferase
MPSMNVEQARFNMIEQQIRPWDVLDTSVLALLSAVRREDFVPAEHRAQAFMDIEIPLGKGRCLLAPRVEARMVQDLNLSKRDTVLLVGACTGYVAALLAHKAQRVIALEADAELAAAARANLRKAGVSNAEVVQADGAAGYPGQAPYDAILLMGSVAHVPQALLDQLKTGGRLLAVVGQDPIMQAVLHTRDTDASFKQQALFDTVAPRLPGFSEPSRFQF